MKFDLEDLKLTDSVKCRIQIYYVCGGQNEVIHVAFCVVLVDNFYYRSTKTIVGVSI